MYEREHKFLVFLQEITELLTAFGEVLYDATLMMGGVYFIAAAAVILSFVFRKRGKIKASIWTNVIAFAYIAVVLTVNYFAGKVL